MDTTPAPSSPVSNAPTPISSPQGSGVGEVGGGGEPVSQGENDRSLLADLRSELSKNFSPESPTPATAPVTPDAALAQDGVPPPPAQTTTDPQQSPATPTLDLSSLDPNTRKTLEEVAGGDPVRMLAYAAELLKGQAPPVSPQTPAPTPTPESTQPQIQAIPPTPDPQVVESTVKTWLTNDVEVQSWAQEITGFVQQKQQADSTLPTLRDQLRTEEIRLTIPQVVGDAYEHQQTQQKILQLRQEINIAQQQQFYSEQRINDLRRRFYDRSNFYRDDLANQHATKYQQHIQQQQQEQAKSSWMREMSFKLPVETKLAIQRHDIHPELLGEFEQYVNAASYRLPPGQFVGPQNLVSFLDQVAVQYKQVLDKHQRIWSGHLGQKARAAAAQSSTGAIPNTNPGSNSAPESQTPNRYPTQEAQDRAIREDLRQELLARTGRR